MQERLLMSNMQAIILFFKSNISLIDIHLHLTSNFYHSVVSPKILHAVFFTKSITVFRLLANSPMNFGPSFPILAAFSRNSRNRLSLSDSRDSLFFCQISILHLQTGVITLALIFQKYYLLLRHICHMILNYHFLRSNNIINKYAQILKRDYHRYGKILNKEILARDTTIIKKTIICSI